MQLRQTTSKIALLILVAAAFVLPASAQSDKSAAIISEMIATLGGQTFLDAREIKVTGKAFSIRNDRASGATTFIDYIKFPDKDRVEIGNFAIKPTTIHNGDSGWSVNDKKVDALPGAEVRDFQAGFKTGFQYLARFVLGRPGLTMQLVGSELVDFNRNDVIEFRDSGNFFRLYVDQKSHLPSKMEVRRSGDSILREEQFANWHVFQGIQTPLYIIRLENGDKTSEVHYDNVSYNAGLADSLFAPPAAR